jgi:cell division transport system ATP-binding protein
LKEFSDRDETGTIVRFDGVGLRYGRSPETLQDLSFELKAGSFHFLTGPSGAGKSSLLKLIYLAHRPSRGRIELFGKDIGRTKRQTLPFLRRRIGVVFQEMHLLEHMSAFDNVALPMRLAGQKPATYRSDIAELLQWVGLGTKMQAMPETLSGGERQRLAIARAVVARPEIILADEPTGNLDHEMGQRILKLFTELNRLGTTVLIASHDMDLVASSGLPAFNIENGRLTAPSIDQSQNSLDDDLGMIARAEPELIFRRPLTLGQEDSLEDEGP